MHSDPEACRRADIAATDRWIECAERMITQRRCVLARELRCSEATVDEARLLRDMLLMLGEMKQYRNDLLSEMGYGWTPSTRKPRLGLVLG